MEAARYSLPVAVAILTLTEVCGTLFLSAWVRKGNVVLLLCGIYAYAFLGVAIAWSLRIVRHTATLNAVWQSASICVVSLVSTFCFGEPMGGRQLIGTVLASAATLCFM